MTVVAKTIVVCLDKTQLSPTAGSDIRGAGYRQGLEGWMMPILSHKSQVVQPRLYSRSKILVEMGVQLKGVTGPWQGSMRMCWGLEGSLFVLHAQVQSLKMELRLLVQTGAITESLDPYHTDTLLLESQSIYIPRGFYYPYVSKHGSEFQWGKMTFLKSPWPLRVELGRELWIFFLASLASRGALNGGQWLGWGVLSACKPLPQTQNGMWSRA